MTSSQSVSRLKATFSCVHFIASPMSRFLKQGGCFYTVVLAYAPIFPLLLIPYGQDE